MNALDRYRGSLETSAVPIEIETMRSEAADRLDMQKLISAFRRRRGLFLAILTACVALAALITSQQQPIFVSSARVMINTREEQVTPQADPGVLSSLPSTSSATDTEVEVIRSRNLARRVSAELNLAANPAFNPSLRPQAPGLVDRLLGREAAKPAARPANDPTLQAYIVDRLLSHLAVARVGETFAISIGYSSHDPEEAAKIANTFAEMYIADQLEAKFNASRQASTFLASRIEQLRSQAAADAAAAQQYRIANNLLSTSGASLTEQEISAYNQEVAQARADAAEAEARLSTAKAQLAGGSTGDDVGEALGSGVITSLRAQRAAVSSRVADLQGRYGPRHPDLLKAQRELADLDAEIQGEISRVISNLEAKSEVADRRLASLSTSLAGARGALTQNNRALVGLRDLEQKAAASQALYESYLNRFKQTGAQEGTEQADARIISEARVPNAPAGPNAPLNLILGAVLGVALGMAAVVISEMLDNSLTTAEDVERRLGRRCLAGVPLLTSLRRRQRTSPAMAVVDRPSSAYAEAFRNLRASLLFYGSRDHVGAVAVTSALPQEGKTTVALCLARSAALQGQRVVLLDCDLRRRQLNQFAWDAGAPGLIDLLAGRATVEETLVMDPESGAKILPLRDGQTEGDDLIGGLAMDRLLHDLRDKFDLVVLDTAPVLPIADTRVLATKVDKVVLVTRWRKTSEHAVQAALRLLPSEGAEVGVVLNRINIRKQMRIGLGDPHYHFRKYETYYG